MPTVCTALCFVSVNGVFDSWKYKTNNVATKRLNTIIEFIYFSESTYEKQNSSTHVCNTWHPYIHCIVYCTCLTQQNTRNYSYTTRYRYRYRCMVCVAYRKSEPKFNSSSSAWNRLKFNFHIRIRNSQALVKLCHIPLSD